MGSQLVLLELEVQKLSARGWNRQDLEQKRPHIQYLMREKGSSTSVSRKKGRSEDTALRNAGFSVFCLFIL